MIDNKDAIISELKSTLLNMLKYCECGGKGYRSWNMGETVKRCSRSTCIKAREILGIPDSDYLLQHEGRLKQREKSIKEIESKLQKDYCKYEYDEKNAVIEVNYDELKGAADTLAIRLGAKDRQDMFARFMDKGYDGLDVELVISAYKHLLGE